MNLFHYGDPDYQTDEKWWEQVLEHERIATALKEGKKVDIGPAIPDDPTEEFKDGAQTPDGDGQMPPESAQPLTEEQRVTLLLAHGIPIQELHGEFSVSGISARPAKLRSFIVRGQDLNDVEGRRVPVWVTGNGRRADRFRRS